MAAGRQLGLVPHPGLFPPKSVPHPAGIPSSATDPEAICQRFSGGDGEGGGRICGGSDTSQPLIQRMEFLCQCPVGAGKSLAVPRDSQPLDILSRSGDGTTAVPRLPVRCLQCSKPPCFLRFSSLGTVPRQKSHRLPICSTPMPCTTSIQTRTWRWRSITMIEVTACLPSTSWRLHAVPVRGESLRCRLRQGLPQRQAIRQQQGGRSEAHRKE